MPGLPELVLQNLLDQLVKKGVIDRNDVREIMSECLLIASKLEQTTATPGQIAGARLEEQIRKFFSVFPTLDGTRPSSK